LALAFSAPGVGVSCRYRRSSCRRGKQNGRGGEKQSVGVARQDQLRKDKLEEIRHGLEEAPQRLRHVERAEAPLHPRQQA